MSPLPGQSELADERPWWYQPHAALLVLIIVAVYLSRLTALPIAGEEARWGRGAAQMIETGDWIVLRQQGQVFPERPPMTSWAMAVVGLLRGQVDDVALRFPSVLAVLLMALVIYAYACQFLTRFGALSAGVVYATMGQVLQIGRIGESEALFTLFVGSSLLVWHLGYMRSWSSAWTWMAGYALAALGALVKGPQAPLYFIAAVGVYLLVQGRWRRLLSWGHALGVAVFVAIVGAWQVPYYLATDWPSVMATWSGLAGDRFVLRGLLAHLLTYPLETLGCLLPWSPLLVVLARPRFRQSLADARPYVVFLLTAIAVTYPSVWFAARAKGRYFMPLYPCFAVLIGLIVERCVRSSLGSRTRGDWNRYLLGMVVAVSALGACILWASLVPATRFLPRGQPLWFGVLFAVLATVTGMVMLWAWRDGGRQSSQAAVITLAAFLGLAYCGAAVNHYAAYWNNARPRVARIKGLLPQPDRLVSFGPVDHRFAYFYGATIQQLPWPTAAADVPPGVTYFCMNQFASDTPERRSMGRGRTWTTVPGKLPVAWEKVTDVCCERVVREQPGRVVIIGRLVGPPATVVGARPQGAKTVR